MRVTSIQYRTM